MTRSTAAALPAVSGARSAIIGDGVPSRAIATTTAAPASRTISLTPASQRSATATPSAIVSGLRRAARANAITAATTIATITGAIP